MPRSKAFVFSGAHRDASNRVLLDRLIEQEDDGHIVGLIVVTLCRKGGAKEYFLSTAGWADENPTLAVGAMASCQALLQTDALIKAGLFDPEI